jgi:hypothetical protein
MLPNPSVPTAAGAIPPNNSPGAAAGPNPEEVRQQAGLRLVRARRKTVGGAEVQALLASMSTIPYPGGQRAGPIIREEAESLLSAFIALSTEEGSDLQLNQLLQAMAGQFEDQLTSTAAIE